MTEQHRKRKSVLRPSVGILPRGESGIALLLTLLALTVFPHSDLHGLQQRNRGGVSATTMKPACRPARPPWPASIMRASCCGGCEFSDLLKGPDGTYSTNSTYLADARHGLPSEIRCHGHWLAL